jgi:hypothetical protein
VKIEFHVIELMAVEMISWKIHMLIDYFFDIVKLKEKNEDILIFQPYVRLKTIGSVK